MSNSKKDSHPVCWNCVHYEACQSWNIGNLATALSGACAKFETTAMFLDRRNLKVKENQDDETRKGD